MAKRRVACEVTVFFIDLLEAVEIDDEQGEGAAGAGGSHGLCRKPLRKQPPVGQAGQFVRQRELRDFAPEPVHGHGDEAEILHAAADDDARKRIGFDRIVEAAIRMAAMSAKFMAASTAWPATPISIGTDCAVA